MRALGCFLVFTCILAAIPAYADSDLTIFGGAQHQGKLTLQSATQTATTTSNLNPTTYKLFGVWLVFAAIFYFLYSARNSRLEKLAATAGAAARP